MLNKDLLRGHTKGPWQSKLVDENDPDWHLCEIYWGDISEGADDSAGGYIATGGIGVENSRLIAAAPDLLAEHDALCELVEAQDEMIAFLVNEFTDRMSNKQAEQHDYHFAKITTLRGRLHIE
jgi:hypothetical protein